MKSIGLSDHRLGMTPDSFSLNSAPGYTVTPIRSEEGLTSLEADWNRLSETVDLPNVFMTYDWFRAWNQCRTGEACPGLRRPEVLVVKREDEVAGIAPLIYRQSSRFGLVVRRLESLASPSDYRDIVVGDNLSGQIAALVDFLVRTRDQWDVVDLENIRETGNLVSFLEKALAGTQLAYRILPQNRCPYLPIEAPWSALSNRISRRDRRRFRAQQNRLEEMSAEGLRVRVIENPQDEPGLLEKLITLEQQKHVEGKLVDPFLAEYPGVFHSLFDTLGPRGWMYVALMELGNRPIAWLMGFRCGKKLWDYQGAYDHNYSRLSPGTMLVPAVLDYGYSHGYDEYDFLVGEEPYKLRWSTGVHQTFRLHIWSRRWFSRAYLAWEAVNRKLSAT